MKNNQPAATELALDATKLLGIRELPEGTKVSFKNMEHDESIHGEIMNYEGAGSVVFGKNQNGEECYVTIQRLATDPAWIRVENEVGRL